MRSLKSHLIDDWRSAWKFGSVQFSALSVVMNVYGAIALKGAAAAASVLGIFSMRQALLIGAVIAAVYFLLEKKRGGI